jgi:hypothetical protein
VTGRLVRTTKLLFFPHGNYYFAELKRVEAKNP